MTNNSLRQMLVTVFMVLAITGATTLAANAETIQAKNRVTVMPKCNLHSLNGSYGLTVAGQNIFPPSTSIPIATVGIVDFDGDGSLSGNVTTSFGGNVGSVAITGTYTMESNCTGTFGVVFPNGFAISHSFVLVDEGKEMLFIQTDQGSVNTGKARRQ